jgi:multidrug efflux pump subunit AcrA (membrane-fusion protein)
VAKIRIVLESKQDALWLPPEAVRSFEGRRFVVVREGERERRVTVTVGIETEDRAEITEGVEEGDVIVGQ